MSDDDDLEDEVTETQEKKPIKTTFELNDTLWAEAELDETDTVYLWLGVRLNLFNDQVAMFTLTISFRTGQRDVVIQNPSCHCTPPVQT